MITLGILSLDSLDEVWVHSTESAYQLKDKLANFHVLLRLHKICYRCKQVWEVEVRLDYETRIYDDRNQSVDCHLALD